MPPFDELWPVRDGVLLPASLDLDPSDPHHRDAHRIGVELLGEVVGSHSVRLVGSAAAREPDAAPPRDLDLVVLLRDPRAAESARTAARAVAESWRSRVDLPVDVVVVPLPMLLDNPFLHLPTVFQSVLVCGEPLPERTSSLPADWNTAWVLWEARRREAKAIRGDLSRAFADNAPPAAIAQLVQRLRKRILRLVAPVALAQEHVYTTDLRRCADLLARVKPTSASLARAVLRDLERDDTSVEAVERLTALSVQVLALDEVVRSKAGAAVPSEEPPRRSPTPVLGATAPRLADLLAPIGVEEFFGTYFEKQHLHVPRTAGRRFDSILDIARVERILWQHCDHLADFAKVRRDDAYVAIPPKQPFQWVRQQFNHGSSIVLNNLQNYDREFAEFHRQLEDDLQMPVAANVYLTPASERTFSPHFDSHDAFVVQLHGTKTWRIHGEAVPWPMTHHERPLDPSRLSPPSAKIDLRPGDVLYIPRGTVHWASANAEPSLHVTLGWYPLRNVDLLQNLVRLAADAIPELRRAVPREHLLTETGPSLSRMLALFADFAAREGASRAGVAKWVDKRVARSQVVPDGGLLGIQTETELAIDDWIERYSGLRCRVSVTQDRAQIVFGGYPSGSDDDRPASFAGPSFLAETFDYIAATSSPFCISSLPGAMTDQSKLVLAQQLLAAGLLRRVRRPPSPQLAPEAAVATS